MPVENSHRFGPPPRAVKLTALVLLAFTGLLGSARAQPPTPPAKRALKPPPNVNGPTEVSLGFYVLNLGKINQTEETFDIAGLLTTSWTDPRLAFDPKEVGESVMRFSPDQIWVPELTVVNVANLQRKTPVQLSVKPDGVVKSVEFVAVTVSADFHLRKFPFDSQTAIVIWEPLSSEVQPVKLVDNPGAHGFSKESYVTLSEWDIQAAHSAVAQRKAETGDVSFPRLTFDMTIRRNSGYYLFKVFIPLLLITVISWTAFWINPATAFVPQMNLGIISVLSAITFNVTVTSALPRIPYATLLDGYIGTCFLFFFLSILAVVYLHVLITGGKSELAMRLIRKFRWAFPAAFVVVQGVSLVTFLFA